MNKRTRNLLVLIICLLLVAAAGFITIKLAKEEEETTTAETTTESFTILELDTSKIVHVDWKFGGFIDESFTKKDGTWVYDADPETFFYQEVFNEWVDRNLGSIIAYQKIESTDYSSMGFENTDTVAHITMADGTEHSLLFGGSTAMQGTCYFRLDEGTEVYTVSRKNKAMFGLNLANYQTTTTDEEEE